MSPNFFRFVVVDKRIGDSWTTSKSLLFSFDNSGEWYGVSGDASLESFSDSWGDASFAETFEHGQSFGGTISDGALASFSDSWGDASFAETYEHGQSFPGTISDGALASFSDTWGDGTIEADEENW